MLDEKKGTCCHKCGHVHVKGTSCPTPFLKGERSCARRSLKEDDYSVPLNAQSGDTAIDGDINEDKISKEVKCKECGWHWKLEDGGKDPYICHKCGCDNTPIQKEMHTMDHDAHDEHHQLRADIEETDNYCPHCLAEYIMEHVSNLEEAEYRGRKVSLGKPFLTPGGPKKRSVYVKNAKGNVVKVNFGDPNMRIKKSNPKRRKSYRARHHCDNPGPRWKANYWSCRAW